MTGLSMQGDSMSRILRKMSVVKTARLTRAAAVTLLLLCSPTLAGADVVLDWNVTMLTTLSGLSPFVTQRYASITQLAVFEAVNAVTGEYEPYLGTITAAPGSSPEAAAASAAHSVLIFYFPAKAAALNTALAASLA